MNSMKRQKDRTLKDELPRSVGTQYATGDQWRNNSRKNEETEAKQKQHPVVDMTGDGSKVRCCKEQYCIGTWNVRSMNQGKLEMVKQEMARVNIDILGIIELKWYDLNQIPYIYTVEVRNRFKGLDLIECLKKEMATHSSTLVWKITWMKEPGIARVGHD